MLHTTQYMCYLPSSSSDLKRSQGEHIIWRCALKYRVIQEESAILWEMIVCVILSKKVHMNMGPILNGYRDMACTFPRLNPLGFLFMGMAKEGGVPHQSGYTCWPCSSHQQCLCPYKGTPSWATACNTQYPATCSQVHWGWWRHLWKFVMRCARRRRARVLSIADHQWHNDEYLHACDVSCDVIYYIIAVRARRMVCIVFLPYLGNRSKLDPCSYELFCYHFPKYWQIPPESPCRCPKRVVIYDVK